MFLSNFSIKQPVTTLAIIIVLMCLGLLALANLRVNPNPDVEMPVMSINFPYPGASPETVEREIINRVERPFQSIPMVYEMWATASESNANFTIFFDFGKDMSEAGDDIRNAIASVRYKLPLEMREPVLYRRDISSEPIVQMGLSSSKQTHAQISRLAEDVLADQFRGIPGVAVVNVDGALRRELSVLLHAQKLREYNVSAGEVVNALREQNTNAPVGRVKGELDEQNIRLVGRIETVTLDLVRRTKQAADDLGCVVRLHAAQGLRELAYIRRWHGKHSIELLHSLGFLGPRTLIPHAWAINGHSREDQNWVTGVNVVSGWQWRGAGSQHRFRIGMQYYQGPALQFSFVGRDEKLLGGGLWFDY